jgi:hypothetical protein
VLPEYLKPRYEHFSPLRTQLRITPSFAEAPRNGEITICYTFITHIKVLQHSDSTGCLVTSSVDYAPAYHPHLSAQIVR